MKESDQASQERLEALRREIATAQEDLDKRKAEWQNEKDAIVNVQELKSELEGAQLEEERATREGDLVKASEIRYARIPDLQRRLHDAEEALNVKQQDGAILKEEVSDDEIAEVVSTWTGIPVQKMMQGDVVSSKRGSGIGVKNVNDRIKLYFGEAYGVQIISAPDEGTTARIYFPMRRQEDETEK